MPTYDYKCDACGHAFEQVQSIKADSLKKCPECGKQKLRRLIGTGGGFIFKGSGFYITDYRDSAYKEKAKADAGGGETKSETKDSKESKPSAETKADSKSSGPSAEAKPTKAEAPAAASPSSTQASSSKSGSGQASKSDGKSKSEK
jgi:putative FmdB family regulatory protein